MANVNELLLRIAGDGSGAVGAIDDVGSKLSGFLPPQAAIAAAAVTLIAAAFVGVAVAGTNAYDKVKRSMNKFAASTGLTKKETKELEKSLLNIYEGNYGEDYNDIAEAMAKVKQNAEALGLKSTKAIEDTTKDALILRDTFDFEVNDSVNAVSALMQNFGLTSKEAFNLIAQGAQKGANKNGDLLEIINEYSPQFKALGMDSEEMFNTLISGARSGAFSIDKVGDAVKEFNIRAKDGSKTTSQAFETLGLDSKKLTKQFANGGKDAHDAFMEVNTALLKMKDPVKQNAVGVALWGTQYEDLEKKGITSIIEIDDETNKAENSLKKINDIRYDDLGSALAGLKRQFEVSILIPIGKVTLPILLKMIDIFKKVKEAVAKQLIPILEKVKDKLLASFKFKTGDVDNLIDIFIAKIPNAFKEMKKIAFPIFDDLIGIFKNISKSVSPEFKQAFVDLIKNEFPIIAEKVKEAYKAIGDFVAGIKKFTESDVFKLLVNIFLGLGYVILDTFFLIEESMIDLTKTLYKLFGQIIELVANVFSGKWGKAFGNIADITETVTEFVIDLLGNIITWVLKLIDPSGKMAKNVGKAFRDVKNVVKDAFSVSKSKIGEFISFIKNSLASGIRESVNKAKSSLNRLVSDIKGMVSGAKSAAKSVINGIKSVFSGLGNLLVKSGKSLIDGFIKGIKSKTNEAKRAINNLAKSVRNFLPFSPAKEGPLSDLDKTGPAFVRTIVQGIKDRKPSLIQEVSNISSNLNNLNFVPQNNNFSLGQISAPIIVEIKGNNIWDARAVDAIGQKIVGRLESYGIKPIGRRI